MKHPAINYTMIVAAALGVGAVVLCLKGAPRSATETPTAQPPEKQTVRTRSIAHNRPSPPPAPPKPEPKAVQQRPKPPAKPAAQPVNRKIAAPQSNRSPALRYWEQQAHRFAQQNEQLMREEDPARRKSLIEAMSRYVRLDTPTAIDWAMNMTDANELRTALNAINKNALSGIGARIEVDETGFPFIRETTVLSAIAATGQVNEGDYIVGVQDENGRSIYFEGRSAAEVAHHLRGKPGTEIQLMMERVPADGSPPQSFNVTLQRSLIVVEPPSY